MGFTSLKKFVKPLRKARKRRSRTAKGTGLVSSFDTTFSFDLPKRAKRRR